MAISELDLQKAKAKTISEHFKKAAAHHEGHADDDEKCAAAHKAHADHHEKRMGKAEDPEHEYHKASASFHKSLAKFAEKMGKREKEYSEHCSKMAAAHDAEKKDEKEKKAAFTELGIEIEETTGDPMSKTDPTPAVIPAVVTTPATQTPVLADGEENSIAKQLRDGVLEATKNGVKEILASPDFKKMIQEQLANTMLAELNKQAIAPTPVKTFAVPRTGTTKEQISSGATPKVESAGVDPEFAHLVSMDN